MRLELDLSPDDWDDYKSAGGDLKRVGVLIPVEPVGVRAFVRLGVRTDDGQALTVLTPWLIWQAAHRALAERLGETPAREPAEVIGEDTALDPPPVLAAIQEAMAGHGRRWDLTPEHHDGTDADEWGGSAMSARADATEAAMTGDLTWAHTLLEAVHAALATEDQGELSQALAAVAGTAANWMTAIDERAADVA